MALQTANQFQLGTDFSGLGRGFAQGQQIGAQFQQAQRQKQAAQQATQLGQFAGQAIGGDQAALGQIAAIDPKKATQIQSFLANQSEVDRAEGLRENEVLTRTALSALSIQDPVQRRAFLTQKREEFALDKKDTSNIDQALAMDEAGLTQALTLQAQEGQTIAQLAATQFPKAAEPVSALDTAKIAKLKAETVKIQEKEVTPKDLSTKGLKTITGSLSPELAEQAEAAFNLAGGGKDGLKALNDVIKTGVEAERRAAAPETLKANFPQADEAELQELQAVVDSSKTTESGFKEASKLRTKQRQVKKGKVFQKRAVDLLDRILNADELNDVLGSIEGTDEGFIFGQKIRGDAESEIIADIEEAGNILTADNLDIMSGVLSETDIKIIANLAGGALNRKRGEAAFIKDVTELRGKLQAALGVVGGDKLPKGTVDNKDGTFTLPGGQVVRRKRG